MTRAHQNGDQKPLTPRERRMLEILTAVADAGDVCPTNEQLCGQMGMQSIGEPPAIMNRLAKRKLVRVERFKQSRIVTIIATGKATGGKRGDPHPSTFGQQTIPQNRLSDDEALIFKKNLTEYLDRTGTARMNLSLEALGHVNGVQNVLAARNPNRDTAAAFEAVMRDHPDGYAVNEKAFSPHKSQKASPDPYMASDELEARRGEVARRHAEHVRQCESAHRAKYGSAPFGRPLEVMPV